MHAREEDHFGLKVRLILIFHMRFVLKWILSNLITESTESMSLVNTHQLQCCLQLNLAHDSVDMRPNTYETTRTSTSSLHSIIAGR